MMLNPYQGGIFRVSQPFSLGGHNGLDIVGVSSKKLLAISDGTVYQSRIITDKSNLTWQWGNYVTIKADTGELITYAHLSQRLVEKGQRISAGEVIGIEGNTGYSFGSHCHLEVRDGNNTVTANINTPAYTDIPNVIGRYTVEKETEELTKEEVQAMIDASKEKIYHYWSEIEKLPGDVYPAALAMYRAGYFLGESPSDLNVSKTKLECVVMIARTLKAQGKLTY